MDKMLFHKLLQSDLNLNSRDCVAIVNILLHLSEGKSLASLPTDLYGSSTVAAMMARQSIPDFEKKLRSMRSSTKRSQEVRIARAEETFVRYLRWLEEEKVTWRTFEKAVKELLHKLYTELYYLGKKGSGANLGELLPSLTSSEQKMIDSMVAHEKRYLFHFMKAIRQGKVADPVKRFRRYLESARVAYSNALVIGLPPYAVIHWKMERNACEECRQLERWSPYTKFTLPSMPKGGLTRCLNNCRCRITFKEGTPQQIAEITKSSLTRKYMQELLRRSKIRR